MRDWNKVNDELNKMFFEIFKGVNINELDFYTRRKMIFEYLCNNIVYDYELLEKIKINNLNRDIGVKRDAYLEIESVLKNRMGVCNAIAQVYKLLLEKVNIYSLCVICDDSTNIKHQLNLVYDEENDSFSFDDVTSVIVNRGTVDEFYDYDLEDATKNKQGGKPVYNGNCWMYLPTDYIYFLVGKNDSEYLKYNYEQNKSYEIPNNIISNKKRTKAL